MTILVVHGSGEGFAAEVCREGPGLRGVGRYPGERSRGAPGSGMSVGAGAGADRAAGTARRGIGPGQGGGVSGGLFSGESGGARAAGCLRCPGGLHGGGQAGPQGWSTVGSSAGRPGGKVQ